MELSIQALSTKNQNDFFSLFDDVTFAHELNWKSCYCISYHTTYTGKEWISRTREENKNEAKEKITNGDLTGYLAFDGDLCIGWVNVNETSKYLRIIDDLDAQFKDGKTALAICYIVKESYRGKHVASSLLDFAIIDCKQRGYNTLIALAHNSKTHVHNYRGPLKMYLDRGFKELYDESGTLYVVRKL